MDMSGEYHIAAPRETVWKALNDPEILRQCIPGCEEIEKVSDTEFTAKAKVKVGPVNARFTGRVLLSDLDPPNGYTITGEGQGGAAGFGKGGARVALTEQGPGFTLLTYTAEAQVGGKLAQIGSRLVQGTARKMADDFFAKFSAVVGGGVAPGVTPTRPDQEDPMLHTTDPGPDGMTVPPAPRPEPADMPFAGPAAAVPGDALTPGITGGNAPPMELSGAYSDVHAAPMRSSPDAPGQRASIGPMVWIPVLVVVLALALWMIL